MPRIPRRERWGTCGILQRKELHGNAFPGWVKVWFSLVIMRVYGFPGGCWWPHRWQGTGALQQFNIDIVIVPFKSKISCMDLKLWTRTALKL